ncbi:MAG: ATP-binding protein [Chloroflexi bacterium]|nr:ATP-binding protein [Chloroflexota bacterium]
MAKSKIDETIKNLASVTSKTRSKSSPAAETLHDLPGDPNCPHCHGAGYLRNDVPVGHPDFGKLQVCVCRRANVTNAVRERLFALSHLDELKDLTFESFKLRGRKGLGEMHANSLEQGFNQARHYAQSLNGWLLLSGGYGCGKTHLAAAVANFAVGMGVPTLFLTVPDLLDTLRFAYNDQDTTFEQRFDEIRNAKLLVLDDFGTQNATGWAQEKLFQIVNYRYINKLPTVMTTNLALDEIEARIRSRLSDPELVTQTKISAPDFRRPMADAGHPELSSLDLHSSRTFEHFSLRKDESLPAPELKSLKDAYEAAQAFAQKPRGWLVLTGDYACGKTHLAAAIANHRAEMGDPPLFVMVPDLLDHLRATFSPNSQTTFDRRFDEIRTAPLLVLDDLGTQSMTPWVREKLYQLFNYRYNAELPTVITIAADSLEEMDARIRSRLLDTRLCKIIGMTVPAYHGKSAAKKSAKK